MPAPPPGVNPYHALMATHPDVLIIGGGIIGLTSAYFLAKAGRTVEVLDRGELGQEASWAGAGIIPPGNVPFAATPIDRLRAVGSERFPGFSQELKHLTGLDTGYVRCGGVEILDESDLDLVAAWRAERIRFEQTGPARFEFPDLAQVRNPWHLRALIAACDRTGVRLRPRMEVEGWGSLPTAGSYLVAAGAWSANLVPSLPVKPVRGQIVLFHPPAPLFSRVVLAGKRYLVPRPDGRVLAGSTEEPEAGFAKGNTPEAVRELCEFAYAHVPELRAAPVEKTWSGLRPGSPDGMPFIGKVPGYANRFVAAGHFRAGVQLSIGTAEIVTALLTDTPLPCPVEAFAVDRSPDVSVRPAFRS
jgi:glycine oxidase